MKTLFDEAFDLAALDGLAGRFVEVMTRLNTEIATRPILVGVAGDMGAGKTTFIRSVLAHMGAHTAGTSPTFDLIHRHRALFGSILHLDLYRLDSAQVEALDLEHYFDESTRFVFIEWPDRAPWVGFNIDIVIRVDDVGYRQFFVRLNAESMGNTSMLTR